MEEPPNLEDIGITRTNLKETYPCTCAFCDKIFRAAPSLMMVFGINSGHGKCTRCHILLHLAIDPNNERMISTVYSGSPQSLLDGAESLSSGKAGVQQESHAQIDPLNSDQRMELHRKVLAVSAANAQRYEYLRAHFATDLMALLASKPYAPSGSQDAARLDEVVDAARAHAKEASAPIFPKGSV